MRPRWLYPRPLPLGLGALLVAVVAAATLFDARADACTPDGQPGYSGGPAPDPKTFPPAVGDFKPLWSGMTDPISQPRNVAILFQADSTSAATEAFIRSQITVDVRQNGAAVPGSLTLVEGPADDSSLWQWLPDGAAGPPSGSFQIRITNASADETDRVRDYTVAVEDRDLRPAAPALTTSIARDVVADPSSPVIHCTNSTIATCVGAVPVTVPTGYLAHVGLTYQAPRFSSSDYPFLSSRARVFTRTNGVVANEQVFSDDWDGALAGKVELGPADEYCVSVSAWVRSDPGHPATAEQCKPRGDIDLSVSVDESKNLVADAIPLCENPTFPLGAPVPNGTAAAPGGSSSPSTCSFVLPRRTHGETGPAGLVALALGALFARRGRFRTRRGRRGQPRRAQTTG